MSEPIDPAASLCREYHALQTGYNAAPDHLVNDDGFSTRHADETCKIEEDIASTPATSIAGLVAQLDLLRRVDDDTVINPDLVNRLIDTIVAGLRRLVAS